MKIVLTAINAKYVHTSLSVRCLHASVKDICDSVIREYTINDSVDNIVSDLYAQSADIIAFSCYIWNIDMVIKVSEILKKANPDIRIVLGGHEVEYDPEVVLKNNPQIDVVVRGEGEITFKNYISAVVNGADTDSLCGITYRKDGKIVHLPDSDEYPDLNSLPFVYDEGIEDIKNRIIYYESSRGCPYGCTYCISGDSSKVRFLDTERVKSELGFFREHKVGLVKFVDRTFNANPGRAKEIFRFIAENPSQTCFHMELAGDIIDDETIEILSHIPKGALQFEIGVQTTNPHTMRAINRNVSFEKLSKAVSKLMKMDNIHIHLDLIAGLPHEDMTSFRRSFDDVLSLRPHVLQLGFLKMLKGSQIRAGQEIHGFLYSSKPPYEVIGNKYINYIDILELKRVETTLDRYYNSGAFNETMNYLLGKQTSSYGVFLKIADYYAQNFQTSSAFSKQSLYDNLYNCFKDEGREFFEALKKDYLVNFRPGKRPEWFDGYDLALLDITYEIFKNEDLKKEHFPKYYDVPAKQIIKHVHAERFSYGVLLFDYSDNSVYNISTFVANM